MQLNGSQGSAFRRAVAVLAIAAFVPIATTACFGRFELVRKVYKFNQEVSEDKWVQELAFLVLAILPVYGLASWIDAIIVNSIEFWTGKNPALEADAGTKRVVQGSNGETAVSRLLPDGSIALEITETNGKAHYLRVVRGLDAVTAYDREGNVLGTVGEVDGQPALLARAQ